MIARQLAFVLTIAGCAGPVTGQSGERARPLPPGYGSLSQNDLALRVRNDELEIRLIPLNPRVTPLLAPDAFQSLRNLVETHRRGIDSVAARAGVSQPGLALVTFFGQRPDVRFDPQTLTLLIRNQLFRPLGMIPLNAKFPSQQLGVREQASAIYLFEQDIPVDDSFTMAYAELVSEDWQGKQSLLDRERSRVAARARGERRDTTR
ncbi:MAG TPA: hypothetical protein VFH26_02560 [Gemmatimonadales bacterium]|nr:hypothetical protein [Gemmatimonadales bacterium]